ncbi:Endonuclease/exonuclease/phosphatase [Trema orientale]|uniref:Endonuclease/exonuclease/phosphatase n=1 Tax=Trema orientale TaxID=63057 RepID=A0A2P5F9N0_TREOI|nr:Endonuclease/exonuclease/phosphatase [Trema orientale]
MKGPNRKRPQSEDTRDAPPAKRRRSGEPERPHNHRKRRRKSSAETLTGAPKSDPRRVLSGSNRFRFIRSSTRRCGKHRTLESSGVENPRNWVHSSRDSSCYKDKVVIVSYNILGVENASNHKDLYLKVPPKFLEWDRRKTLIREEIHQYNASILCLQEVDRFNDVKDLFQKDGFKGVYKGRTGEAYDGCAIFWKEELFTLLHQENIEFQNFGLRNNVAQLCVLKMNQHNSALDADPQSLAAPIQNRSLVIGNIHVLFNPNRGDIKLGQVRLLLEKAYKLSQDWGRIPVLLCGDLNSIPQSPIYQFLASSKLDIRLYDRRKISGQVEFQSECRAFRFPNEKASRFEISAVLSFPPYQYFWSF